MSNLISCEFNMDIACVEMKVTDGIMIAVDTIVVESVSCRQYVSVVKT